YICKNETLQKGMAGKEVILMVQEAINLFADVVSASIPYAVVFALGQRLVTMFLGMAFKGHVEI
ncbi:hypothetical protein, partial [Enterocloster citroniae]|nr:hypothetical protein [Enterocloster citroniae]